MRATIEHNKNVDEELLPEIDILVILGRKNLSIKVNFFSLISKFFIDWG